MSAENVAQILGVSKERAAELLAQSKGDPELAIGLYYQESGTDPSDVSGAFVSPVQMPAKAPPIKPDPSSSSRIRTFNDLIGSSAARDDQDDDEDDEEPQNFFAGGEKSGVMMQGGPKKGKDLVAQILKRAEQGSAKMQEETGKPDAEKPLFVGTGYRLGSDVVPSEPVGNTKVGAGDATETAVRELTFWRDGFSVGDGALLRYDDPANSELLNHINSGRAPPSLLNIQYGQPVEVRVTRRINEDYVPPPKAPLKPFEGTGTRLGGIVPGESPTPTVSGSATGGPDLAVQPASSYRADQPTTSLQIRLANGTKLVVKMNPTQTIGDLRRIIEQMRPGEAAQAYTLATTFPMRVLTNLAETLEEAKLINAAVVQRRA